MLTVAIGSFTVGRPGHRRPRPGRRFVAPGRGRLPDRERQRRHARIAGRPASGRRASAPWRRATASPTRPVRRSTAGARREHVAPRDRAGGVRRASSPAARSTGRCRRTSRLPPPARRPAPTTTRSRPSSRRGHRPARRRPPSATSSRLTIAGRKVSFRVIEIADTFPGVRTTGSFVVAPYASLVAATGGAITPSVYFVRGDAALEPALEPTSPSSRRPPPSIHATTDTRPSTTRRSSPASPEASVWRWRSRSSTRRWPSSRSSCSTPSGGRASSGSCGRSG